MRSTPLSPGHACPLRSGDRLGVGIRHRTEEVNRATAPLMFELPGSPTVVTGVARGIGLAICEALARQGSRVTLLDADNDAYRRRSRLGPEHRAVCLDVTDHDALSEASSLP